MRRLTWWHWLILVFALATMVAAMLALLVFAPGIQRRAFLAALERPGRTVEVARLSAGLGGLEIEGLVWVEGAVRFNVRELHARFSFLAALGSGPFSVEELEVRGLSADLAVAGVVPSVSGIAPAVPAAGQADTQGHGGDAIAMPVEVRIDRLLADGTLDLGGDAAGADGQVIFELQSENLAVGTVAHVAWRGRMAVRGSASATERSDAAGELLIRPSASRGSEAIAASIHTLLRRVADAVAQSRSTSNKASDKAH